MAEKQFELLTDEELPEGINIKSIIVGSEQDKEQLLLALKYLHDLRNIDTNLVAVNELVRMYRAPEYITVADDDIWHDNVVLSRQFSREQLLPLFEPNSWFMKKLQNSSFYGEFGQPINDWVSRLTRVDTDKICVHIKNIRLNSKDELVGEVKFIGPFKQQLESTLANNTITFGIRASIENKNEKDLKILDIVAFDVNVFN